MSVLHRGIDVFMAKQFLDGANIVAVLQQVRCKGVTKGVAACGLGYPGFTAGFFDRLLQDGFVEVVPTDQAGAGVSGELCGREYNGSSRREKWITT